MASVNAVKALHAARPAKGAGMRYHQMFFLNCPIGFLDLNNITGNTITVIIAISVNDVRRVDKKYLNDKYTMVVIEQE